MDEEFDIFPEDGYDPVEDTMRAFSFYRKLDKMAERFFLDKVNRRIIQDKNYVDLPENFRQTFFNIIDVGFDRPFTIDQVYVGPETGRNAELKIREIFDGLKIKWCLFRVKYGFNDSIDGLVFRELHFPYTFLKTPKPTPQPEPSFPPLPENTTAIWDGKKLICPSKNIELPIAKEKTQKRLDYFFIENHEMIYNGEGHPWMKQVPDDDASTDSLYQFMNRFMNHPDTRKFCNECWGRSADQIFQCDRKYGIKINLSLEDLGPPPDQS